MGDLKFACSGCGQSLVADDSAAGSAITCPGCEHALQIPFPGELDREEIFALERDLAALAAERDSYCRAWTEAEHERQELAQRTHNFEQQRDALRAGLEVQRENALALVAERDQVSQELEQVRQFLAESAEENATLREDIAAFKIHVQRLKQQSAALQSELEGVRAEHGQIAGELHTARQTVSDKDAALTAAETEREKLRSDLKLNPELEKFVALKDDGERLQALLHRREREHQESRDEAGALRHEHEALRRKTIELELKLAAAREAASDSHLERDNEVLRALVERLNEELRDRGTPPPKKHRATAPGLPSLSDFKRWVATHAFVPEEG